MSNTKHDFIKFALNLGVLKFGEFTLKSGRVSPYFFNAGLFNNGYALHKLGQYYAKALVDAKLDDFMLFGPAYKGIPLSTTTAVALAADYDMNVDYAFNRKEKKQHGEGGQLVGAPLSGNVVIVDDVITAGTAIRESFDMIANENAKSRAVLIALDRQEKLNDSDQSAIQQVTEDYGVDVYSIITMSDLITYVENDEKYSQYTDVINKYRDTYGCC